MTTLAWLAGVGIRNQLRRRAARLKNPRYALGLLVGLAYFWWIFARPGSPSAAPQTAFSPTVVALAPFGLVLLALWSWIGGSYERSLAFTPAEVDFLFAAPVSRPDLIRFKLLRVQAALLFAVVLIGVLILHGPLPWYCRLIAVWVVLAALNLHQITAALVRIGATERGRAGLRRLGIPLLLVGLVAVAVVWSVATAAGGGSLDAFLTALDRPVPRAALLPFRLVLAPVFAPTGRAFVLALPGALLVLVAQYVWLMRSDAAFEEIAAEAGRARAQRLAALRAGRGLAAPRTKAPRARRLRLPLAPTGHPAVAILWKNLRALIVDLRTSTIVLASVGSAAVAAVIVWSAPSAREGAQGVGALCLMALGVATLFGPRGIRADWRRDLAKAEVLKTWPVGGFSLAAAELGATTLAVALLQYVLLLVAAATLLFGVLPPHEIGPAVAGGAVLLLALPIIDGVLVGIHNAFALLFPAWMAIGAERPGGIEHMGQTILTTVGALALFVIALILPALLAAVVWALLSHVPLAAAAGGALVAIVALAGELVLLIWSLGKLYDRLDPVAAGVAR
ncbi:MAG TPA: putative ABC exporter domain-containing protein [Gemmatimonadales bacterium]|nr:putative ABC exporter domain-containing protein [Gemmatimonadales bacterium]